MMRVAIFLVCWLSACRGGGKSIRHAFQNLGEELGSMSDRVTLLEKEGLPKAGRWHLGMNIHPDDGHIFGYIVGTWFSAVLSLLI